MVVARAAKPAVRRPVLEHDKGGGSEAAEKHRYKEVS